MLRQAIAGCDGCAMLVASPPFHSDEWVSLRLWFPENVRDESERYREDGLRGLWKIDAMGEEPCIWLN